MPRPRRCQVRCGQAHSWTIAGEQFICDNCKEPGPDINDVLLMIWDVRGPRTRSLEDRASLLESLIGRAEGVMSEFEDAAVVMEAELAAAGKGPMRPAGTLTNRRPKDRTEIELNGIVRAGLAHDLNLTWWVIVESQDALGPGLIGFHSAREASQFLSVHFPTSQMRPVELHEHGTASARWVIRVVPDPLLVRQSKA